MHVVTVITCFYFFFRRIQFLRHMHDLFQLTYKVDSKQEDVEMLTRKHTTLTCVGVGYANFTKTIM